MWHRFVTCTCVRGTQTYVIVADAIEKCDTEICINVRKNCVMLNRDVY